MAGLIPGAASAVTSGQYRDSSTREVIPVEIRSVLMTVYRINEFDAEVNTLLADGWRLAKRELVRVEGEPSEAYNAPIVKALYAELERSGQQWPEESTI